MEDWKLLEKVLNGKRVKMTDNGIIYANQNGSIYKTSLGLGQVRYIGEVYKGNVYLSEEVNEKFPIFKTIVNRFAYIPFYIF